MYIGAWWNPFSWGESIIETIVSAIYWLLLTIDCIIYSFVSYIYQIFLVLAQGGQIIDNKFIESLVDRIYVVIGVVMLFLIAYSLLKAMVNPEESIKGKKSPVNIIKDVIISVVLIALLPTIFNFAFGLQNSLLLNNTIGKIIVGTAGMGAADPADTIRDGGYIMAEGVFKAFLHAEPKYCQNKVEECSGNVLNCDSEAEYGISDSGEQCEILIIQDDVTYGDVWLSARQSTTFWNLAALAPEILSGNITYYFLIAPVAGLFVLLVLISYCLDMALRLVKLAVYEVIAPIPIFARIIPNEQAKKVFSNWLKATITTFVEVFIRIGILYFAVFLISVVTSSINDLFSPLISGSARFDVLFIAQALIIVGIVLFVKQAPEIIKEITGLDGGKYNPLKSAKQGLSLIAGTAVGRSPLGGLRAWDQAGQAKSLTDFSAIGNQYKRRLAKQEAKAQGAKWKDRTNDKFRKMFGWETKLEEANRRFERGLDIAGNPYKFTNDTDDKIVLNDGTTIAKGQTVPMTEKLKNELQHKKELNAQDISALDEQKRHTQEGADLNKQYYDLYSEFKKEGEKKTHEGNSDMFTSFYEIEKIWNNQKQKFEWKDKLDANGNKILMKDASTGQSLTNMNYAALENYVKTRQSQGASPAELEQLQYNLQKANDQLRLDYVSREIAKGTGYSSQLWEKFKTLYSANGVFDADTGKTFYLDTDINALASSGNAMELFSKKDSKSYKFVDKDGNAYTGISTTQLEGEGLDLVVKKQQKITAGILQDYDNKKTPFNDENKRIDRAIKYIEESQATEKSSATYQAYKASDTANKINDSGKK